METGTHVQSGPQPRVGYEFAGQPVAREIHREPKVTRVQVHELGLSFGGDACEVDYISA